MFPMCWMGFLNLWGLLIYVAKEERRSTLLRSAKVCAMKIFVEVNQGQWLSQLSSSSLHSKHSSIWTSNITPQLHSIIFTKVMSL